MTDLVLVALITGGLGLIGSLANGFFHVRANRAKRLGNNPHPCKDHADRLKELDDKFDTLLDRISRVEGRLNGLR